MALKTFKPYTPSRRFLTMLDKSEITKQTPEKSLVETQKRTGGRNAHGEVTSWHRGGGHAQKYRVIDFRREKIGIPAKVAAIEYDPEPLGAHRPAALCRRREALHSAAGRLGSRHDGAERRGRGHSAGQCAEHPPHSARHHGAQPWSCIPARAGRWCVRPAAQRNCSARKAISHS